MLRVGDINSNSKYKDINYWNSRYSEEETFEWCKSYKYFRHLIIDHISRSSNILILGCGNSKLSEDLYEDGYKNITNIDFAATAIENAVSKSQANGMAWLVMDIRRLTFMPGSFDVILEKATLDSLLVDEKDPWKLSEDSSLLLDGIFTQISNLLVSGGKFVSLTFAQPHFRKKVLCHPRYDWSVKHFTYGDGFHFFFYVMTKGEECPYFQMENKVNEVMSEARLTDECSSEEDENFINKISDDV